MTFKQKVHRFLHADRTSLFIYTLIIVNVIALIFESYRSFGVPYQPFFEGFELFSITIFTVEYLLRVWTADVARAPGQSALQARLGYVFSWLGLIDLIAILPFYLPLVFTMDLRVARILRLFRLLRIFKVGRYSRALRTISSVLNETKSELIMTLLVAVVLLVFSSTLMYYLESEAQPDKFASIGHSLWWAIATLTTVGYGDVYPVTPLGKLMGGLIALIGIGFIALPTGIISSEFVERLRASKEATRRAEDEARREQCCPHCGKVLEE